MAVRRGGCLVRALVSAAAFAATQLGLTFVLVNRQLESRTQRVGAAIPSRFPVLVVYPGKGNVTDARVVYHKDLGPFQAEHPGWSYLVPLGQERAINGILSKNPSLEDVSLGRNPDPRLASGSVKVERTLPDGNQRLHVEGTWDDDRANTGWYTASDRAVTPERYLRAFGPGIASMASAFAFIINFLAWALAFTGYGLWAWLSRRARHPPELQ